MSLATNWGYNLTDVYKLTDMISIEEFNEFTAGRYARDIRVASAIKAASQAVRNYCGWHVYPSSACSLTESLLYGNGRVKRIGLDLMIQLPARYVTAVSSVTIDGIAHTSFNFDISGTIHVFDVPTLNRKSCVDINYTAGIPDELMGSIKEVVAHRVNHALASSNGVTSEAAGGVSVTYNAGWVNSARASALPDDSQDTLAPYRLQGVF